MPLPHERKYKVQKYKVQSCHYLTSDRGGGAREYKVYITKGMSAGEGRASTKYKGMKYKSAGERCGSIKCKI